MPCPLGMGKVTRSFLPWAGSDTKKPTTPSREFSHFHSSTFSRLRTKKQIFHLFSTALHGHLFYWPHPVWSKQKPIQNVVTFFFIIFLYNLRTNRNLKIHRDSGRRACQGFPKRQQDAHSSNVIPQDLTLPLYREYIIPKLTHYLTLTLQTSLPVC